MKKDFNILDLPVGWVQTDVNTVAVDIVSGSAFPKKYQGESTGEYPFAKVGTISKVFRAGHKTMNSADNYISDNIRLTIKAKTFPKGTIVFPKIGEALKGNYRVITSREMIFDNNVMGIVPDSRCIDGEYFYYCLTTKDFGVFAVATAVPSVRRNDVANISIPLPPHAEQLRIVVKIEELFSELDKGIESLKTAREQLKVYRQAVLKHAFEGKLTAQWREENQDKLETAEVLLKRIQTEREQRYQQQLKEWQKALKKWEAGGKKDKKPAKPSQPKHLPLITPEELADLPQLPEGWAWVKLGDCNVDVFDGPFGSNLKSNDYVDSGVRVIRLENIGVLEFIGEKKSYISAVKYAALKNHTVTSGDIIFASFITEQTRVVVLPPSVTKAVNKADCFCVRIAGETLNKSFVATFLSTRHVYKKLESLIHGIGRPRINTTQLKEVAIPFCSAPEQQAIVMAVESRLSEVSELEKTIDQALQQSEALRQSILKKAFSGQLVPQDPNDEPASVLLERIRAEKASKTGTVSPKRPPKTPRPVRRVR